MTKEEFLAGVENWSNHRHLLWEALEKTEELHLPVIECGMGAGSTPFLYQYCKDAGRLFYSYENNLEWYDKCREFNPHSNLITDWNDVAGLHLTPSVLFLDEAPGEHRKLFLELFAKRARIIVAHDTEPAADHGYQMRQHIPLFKYWKDFESPGAWASMASNFIAF